MWRFVVVLAACGNSSGKAIDIDAPPFQPPAHPDAPLITHDAPPPPAVRFKCQETPPPGAPSPVPPLPPVAGCPTLAPGMNTITTSGKARQFILVAPATSTSEQLPVLFMWHWIGGTAEGFLERGEVQAAADDQHFLAVLPVSEGANVLGTSFNTKWPFDITQAQARIDEETLFFDDMLACVEQQYAVNQNCVSTIGVSAGALFTDVLVQAKSTRLASFISLSGGVGDTIIRPWTGAQHKLPGVVLWGGDGPPTMDGNKDILGCFGIGMDFSVASNDLEKGLVADGHFFIECRHNCGHVEPPLDPPAGESKFAGMWEFALNHPYWLAPGASPYLESGLPASMPAWCAIGAGTSVPRSGPGCPAAENPCQY